MKCRTREPAQIAETLRRGLKRTMQSSPGGARLAAVGGEHRLAHARKRGLVVARRGLAAVAKLELQHTVILLICGQVRHKAHDERGRWASCGSGTAALDPVCRRLVSRGRKCACQTQKHPSVSTPGYTRAIQTTRVPVPCVPLHAEPCLQVLALGR